MLTVSLGGMAVGSVIVARHRAQSAADLAALAAAVRVPVGRDAACRQAGAVAAAVQATLLECVIVGLDVRVSVTTGTGLRVVGDAHATARAGPIGRG